MKNSILLLTVTLIKLAANSQTSVTYDFESLTLGSSIHGQDNWIVESSFSSENNGNICPPAAGTEIQPNIISSTSSGSYTGSQALTGIGKGGQHAFNSRVNDGNWSTPDFTAATGIVMEADWQGNWWGKSFRVGYDSNADGDFSSSCTTVDGNEVSFGFSTSQGNLRLHGANGDIIATGTRPTEWCRIRLCIDVLANSGAGSGSLFYLDHASNGIWVAHSIANVNMGLNTGATDQTNYQNINGILYDQEAGGASVFDNISFDVYYSSFPGCLVILPIHLISFSAIKKDDNIVGINWSTASEYDNDFYTVERSKNGFDWEEIKLIDGAGTSSQLLNYSCIDRSPYQELSYYRLKQTDFNGDFAYSSIKSVYLNSINDVTIYPNPFKNSFTIELSNELNYPVTVEITNLFGAKIYSQEIKKITTEINFDETIPAGTYIVKVYNEKTQIIERIIKRK